MPGTTVTLTNTGTGLVRVVVTDANGEYTVPSLPTGRYTRGGGAPRLQDRHGARTSTLGVDQRLRFNVRLEVGAVSRRR